MQVKVAVNCGSVCRLDVVMDIGQKVRLCRLRDRTSREVIKRLGQLGTVEEYRLVDGSEIGVVVKFDDQFATWFFEDEVEAV